MINDNCHALGSKYNGKKDYATKYADIVTQSFHPLKNITTGEGGAILTNNFNIFDKEFKKLKLSELHPNQKIIVVDLIKELGFNYRLTDFQSALGNEKSVS